MLSDRQPTPPVLHLPEGGSAHSFIVPRLEPVWKAHGLVQEPQELLISGEDVVEAERTQGVVR